MEDQLRELREVEERLLKERSEVVQMTCLPVAFVLLFPTKRMGRPQCEALEAKIRSFAFDPKFSSASKAPAAISDTTSDGNEHTPPPPPPPPRLVETVTPNAVRLPTILFLLISVHTIGGFMSIISLICGI